ncbi:MAG: aminopeptidase P family protein, partial [Bacteroidota bacterium]
MSSTVNSRIQALRVAMQKHRLDAYIIPSSDAHQSEYVAEYWQSRQWISGFTGSAGMVVVTQNHAGLWTDSRYFLQAATELADSEMVLHKQGVPHAPEHNAWLRDNLPKGGRIGLDGKLFSVNQLAHMRRIVQANSSEIITDLDLIKEIWTDRPALPEYPIFEHDVKYAGQDRGTKLATIRQSMRTQGVSYHLVTTLDDIAWTFNIRGKDIDFNPLAIAYALIGLEEAWLFINPAKVPAALGEKFKQENITVYSYNYIGKFLLSLPKTEKILINPATTSVCLADLLTSGQTKKGATISTYLKAIKNETEIKHIRSTMAKDGIALMRLYLWLTQSLETTTVTEYEVAEKLANFRKAQGLYHNESFPAIVGYQGNGAIVHYRPMPETSATIQKEGILLLDSGGQYEDGTTDITRTFALGEPTVEQKRDFTLVLKGHIAIARLVFPKGTKGIQLDAFARHALWQHRLNYGHGTGHGVGFFLNVHEPPQSFATSIARGNTAFAPGMVTSNEPGFYKTDEYGIRIENLVLCVADEKNDYGEFLKLEDLTLFPIDKLLIDKDLLSGQEMEWLNDYHQKVW